jgi:hypothetical protein
MGVFRPRRILIVSGVALALLTPALAQRGPKPPPMGVPPHPVVEKMLKNAGKLRYSGQRIVEFKLESDRYRNVELLSIDGKRMRIEFAAGSSWAGQVIVDGPRGRLQYFPAENEIRQMPKTRDDLSGRIVELLRRAQREKMTIRYADGGSILSRKTTLMEVKDPAGNVIQKLWLDNATGLGLRRELFDPVGTRIGYFEFTRLNFNPRFADSDFTIQRAGAKVVTLSDMVAREARRAGFSASILPATSGAELQVVRTLDVGGKKVLHLVYSVNNRRLSLFQTKGEVSNQALRRMAGREQVHQWTIGGKTLLLVGPYERKFLQELASKITR